MHVAKIEFLGSVQEGPMPTIGVVKSPLTNVKLTKSLGGIRVSFDQPFAPAGVGAPNTAGIGDPNFERHNIIVRLGGDIANQIGLKFVAGSIVIEDPQTVRFDVARGTRLVNERGDWLKGVTVPCELLIRGKADPANGTPSLLDANGKDLDGEPKAPAGGVMSGDGNAGGDFTSKFTVSD
jgi:hypothetical protein